PQGGVTCRGSAPANLVQVPGAEPAVAANQRRNNARRSTTVPFQNSLGVRSEEEVPVKVLTQEEFQRLLEALDASEIWAARNYWLLLLF
ncbi:MAG: hypothetical protein ACYCW6_24125, partial [Candidatus Xenobia bacterium]